MSEIEPLTGGLSMSSVYKIVVDGHSYVLKLDAPVATHPNIPSPDTSSPDASSPDATVPNATVPTETASIATTPTAMASTATPVLPSLSCLEIAAKAGVAPPVFYLDIPEGLLITGFVIQQPLREAFASQEGLLNELGRTIRSIHELPPFPKEQNLLHIVEELVEGARHLPPETDIFEDSFDYYDRIRTHYPWQDPDRVSGHNDLNPNNIIWDGQKTWVVDWDAAFRNDRYVDLATAAIFFVHTDTQEDLFLTAYFGNPPDAYRQSRFFIMRQVCRLVYAILMCKLAHHSKNAGDTPDPGKSSVFSPEGQLLFAKALINAALNDMRSTRFPESIERLAGISESPY
ncbi:MAG: phosphotransferase [Puia sp.]|nr:phosphotransferase [Puia sp.]